MPPDRRLLRDIQSAYDGMERAQLDQGEWVQWFRYLPNQSTSDPTYGTGPQRAWANPVSVPVWIGEYERAGRNQDGDGLYQVDHFHGILSYRFFFSSNIPDPDPNFQNHVNDRVGFDGKLFYLTSFLPRGRVASYFLTISFDATQLALEEFTEDADLNPTLFDQYILAP